MGLVLPKVLNTLVLDSTMLVIKLKLAFQQMSPRVKNLTRGGMYLFQCRHIFLFIVSAPYRDRCLLPLTLADSSKFIGKVWGPALLLIW